jgi:DNA polymerase I-like protein with 3'-5' exonuclease and polymerase domains
VESNLEEVAEEVFEDLSKAGIKTEIIGSDVQREISEVKEVVEDVLEDIVQQVEEEGVPIDANESQILEAAKEFLEEEIKEDLNRSLETAGNDLNLVLVDLSNNATGKIQDQNYTKN